MSQLVALVLSLMIFSAYEDVTAFPTFEDYQNATCPKDTFKCLPYADCCLKDSQMCSTRSYNCQEVFAPGENEHDMCCNALRTDDTTREGLIEACKYRLGSLTWREHCKAKYPEKPQFESSSTVAEINPFTQHEIENVTPIPEASRDWKLGAIIVLALILCVLAVLLCVVLADKCFLFKNEMLRKGNTARCSTCQQELEDPFKMPSTSKLNTDMSKKQVIDFEPSPRNSNNIHLKGAQNRTFDEIAAEKKQNKLNDESEALRQWIEPENGPFFESGASGSEGRNQTRLDVDLAIHRVEMAQPDYCSEETDNFLHERL